MRIKSDNIDQYITGFPEDTQKLLKKVRATIRKSAPEAEETISYGIPTFNLKGKLVHFAAFKSHIGFYPTSSGIEAFRKELSPYKGAKGSVQFPLGTTLHFNLISKIVKFRVRENLEKDKVKAKGRTKEKTKKQ